MQDSEDAGIPDAEYVIQHERDEHPNNPVNEYMMRHPQKAENRPDSAQEDKSQRQHHLNKQLNKRENPQLDPSIVRSQQANQQAAESKQENNEENRQHHQSNNAWDDKAACVAYWQLHL